MLILIYRVLAIEGERRRAVTARLNSDKTQHLPINTTFMNEQLIGSFLPGI